MIVSISLFGYWIIASSTVLETAIIGFQLTFVGRSYLLLSALFILIGFSGAKIKAGVYIPLTALCTFTLFSTMSIGKNFGNSDFFFKTIELKEMNGFHYLETTNGIGCYLFIAQTILIFWFFAGYYMYARLNRKKNSISNCNRIALILLVGVISFFSQIFVESEVSIFPYSYLLMELIMVMWVQKMNIHDIDSNILAHMLKQNDNGYIFVDMRRRFLGCNDLAFKLLPQLRNLEIEKPFRNNSLSVTINMDNWMDELDRLEDAHSFVRRIFDDTRTLRCKVRPLRYGKNGRQVGYTIIISDDTQQQKYINLLNNYNTSLEREVQIQVSHIADMRDNILLSIANIIENRDNSTGDHVKRTSHTVRLFIDYLNRTQPEILQTYHLTDRIWKAAPMHDLGKLAIRDDILTKPGIYTSAEYEEMKQHSEKGAKIVKEVFADIEDEEFIKVAVNIAHYHHEKWDGTGYPSGLKGENIPVEARIMALADVFDALVSDRCYKTAMSYDQAFAVIDNSLGTHFDPVLGRCFTACKDELIQLYEAE